MTTTIMQIANYLLIGALLMFLVDSMTHWMQKTNSDNDYIFTNTERVIVIVFWPIVVLFAIISVLANQNNQN
jgi:hypothetical protein